MAEASGFFRLSNLSNRVDWNWPLTIGIIDPNVEISTKMKRTRWAKEFTNTYEISNWLSFDNPFDILFFDGLDEIRRFYEKYPTPPKATLLLIRVSTNFFEMEHWRDVDLLAHQVAGQSDSSGVIFFFTNEPISTWHDNFLYELSHNRTVTEVVRMLCGEYVRSYTTKDFDQNSKISSVIPKLIKTLRALPLAEKRSISIVFENTGVQKMSFIQLSDYLEVNRDEFKFIFERQTATLIRDIYKGIEQEMESGFKTEAAKRKGSSGNKAVRDEFQIGEYKPKYQFDTSDTHGPITSMPTTGAEHSIKREDKKRPVNPDADKIKVAPRYIQGAFKKPRSKKLETEFLLPSTSYQLCLKIGVADTTFLRVDRPLPEGLVFTVASMDSADIEIQVRLNTQEDLLQGVLRLPRRGDSELIIFKFNTGKKVKALDAEVWAIHKNRVIQKCRLHIDIRKATDNSILKLATFKDELIISSQLDNLDERTAFTTVMAFPDKPDDKQVAGKSGKKLLQFKYSQPFEDMVNKIKFNIEQIALTSSPEGKLTDTENVDMLRRLAGHGSQLYDRFLKLIQPDGPLQLINTSGAYFPVDFAYSRHPPDSTSTLCKHAVDALKEGKCRGCTKSKEDEQKTLCPFGFWALNRVVERYHYIYDSKAPKNAYELKVDPGTARKPLTILENALHGASNKVDEAKKNMTKKVSALIQREFKKSKTVKTWDDWKREIPQNPDSLILIIHVESDPDGGVDSLEIGKDLLEQPQFDERYIGTKAPLVILIGCETTNLNSYMFDTSSQLLSKGAAIVISNFTKIIGDQAGLIVMELVSLLKNNAGNAMNFGEVMLRLRQQLVAKGLLVGLSLTAHGDTDWKIKI